MNLVGTDEDGAAMAARSRLRRERIVAHRATGHADAEAWDLDFWQSQSPEDRLSALVAIRRDVETLGRLRLDARISEESTLVTGLSRITVDPEVMGGKPCIRGLRVTVGTVVGLVAAGHSREEILRLYPYLEAEDIPQALEYAAWRSEEVELPLAGP